ncbi:MAG: CHRD domain-containing protein [SAR202 cluster bacterium]|nr:CHRD domain-containing protein [SAR202 cluster bacterium]
MNRRTSQRSRTAVISHGTRRTNAVRLAILMALAALALIVSNGLASRADAAAGDPHTVRWDVNFNPVREGEAVQLTVLLDRPAEAAVGVEVMTQDMASAGTDVDFVSGSTTLMFGVGESSKTWTVQTIEDSDVDPYEFFVATFQSFVGPVDFDASEDGVTTINIIDDGGEDYIVSFDAPTEVSEGNDDITVNLDRAVTAPDSPLIVNFILSPGTATAGSDYDDRSWETWFNPGESSATFTLATIGDALAEGNETFFFGLDISMVQDNVVAAVAPEVEITILDDDSAPSNPYIVHFLSPDPVEEGQNTNVSLTLDRPVAAGDQAIVVVYTFNYEEDVWPNSAKAHEDYIPFSGPIIFSPGENSKTVSIGTVDDIEDEADIESFFLFFDLSSSTNVTPEPIQSAFLQIADNDVGAPEPYTVAFSVNHTVAEGEISTVVLTLSRPADEPVTVAYATQAGTATEGEDYEAANSSTTFDVGEQSKNVNINTIEDNTVESDETFFLHFQSGGSSPNVSATNSADIMIMDDDEPPSGAVTGVKFNDANGNGVRDAGEAGIEGFTIYIDYDGDNEWDINEPFARTAADGSYTIAGIPVGTYAVREVPQQWWIQTRPGPEYAAVLNAAKEVANPPINSPGTGFARMWNHQPQFASEFTIQVTWQDLTGPKTAMHIHGPGTTLQNAGVLVDLSGMSSGGTQTVSLSPTNQQRLKDGLLYVNIHTSANPGGEIRGQLMKSIPGGYTVNVIADQTRTGIDFGNQRDPNAPTTGTVSGIKFNDLNGNGQRDEGEPGIQGVTIFLDNNENDLHDSGELSAVTDEFGAFVIHNVAPGTHIVDEVTPAGWTQTAPNGGGAFVNVVAGENAGPVFFGNRENLAPGAILGFKFNDLDGNGGWDIDEPPIEGWDIYLDLNNDGEFTDGEPISTTNADGLFEFPALQTGRSYMVGEIQQSGWTQTLPLTNGGRHLIENLGSGDEIIDVIFGNKSDIAYASISGHVWNDLDGDGVRDGDEPGLSGQTVCLDIDNNESCDSGEPFRTTDGDGFYEFLDVVPASFYYINHVLPIGWSRTFPSEGDGRHFLDHVGPFSGHGGDFGARILRAARS